MILWIDSDQHLIRGNGLVGREPNGFVGLSVVDHVNVSLTRETGKRRYNKPRMDDRDDGL